MTTPELHLYTDASDDALAVYFEGRWGCYIFSREERRLPIAAKEIYHGRVMVVRSGKTQWWQDIGRCGR